MKDICLFFPLWIITILLITYFGLSNLPHFIFVNDQKTLQWANSTTDYWIKWSNWDGGHFRGIAENGYLHNFQVAFFPFYPLLIKTLMLFNLNSVWSGITVSYISAFISIIFLYKLTKLDYPEKVAKETVFFLMAFPTSFYLLATYSESIFLALTTTSFYYARNKNYLLAALFAGLSMVTRPIGIAVYVAILSEYYLENVPNFKLKFLWQNIFNRFLIYILTIKFSFIFLSSLAVYFFLWTLVGLIDFFNNYLIIAAVIIFAISLIHIFIKYINVKKIYTVPTLFFIIGLLPILSFFYYLYASQGAPLIFIKYEKEIWHRQTLPPWETPTNYYNILSANNFISIGEHSHTLFEFLFFIIIFLLFIRSAFILRFSYVVFFAIAFLIPLYSGTLIAIHRYTLVIFPIFIALSTLKNPIFKFSWLIFSLTFLGLLSVMFINAYWVT